MASRNRVEMSAALFAALIGRAEEEGIKLSEGARWIKRLDAFDVEMMAKADCDSLIISRQQKAMFINFSKQRFFVVSGFQECDILPLGLIQIEITPAILSLSFQELNILPNASPAEIRDVLEDQHSQLNGYVGHDIKQISGLFPSILCFKTDLDYISASRLERMTGSYACLSYNDGPLMLEHKTKKNISSLFENASDYIPFRLVLQGLLSFSWSAQYLELYRCLEQLYSAPRLEELSRQIPLDRSLFDVAEILEIVLSWRPREDEALVKVLRYCSKGSIDAVLLALEREPCVEYDKAVESAGRGIYQLRNSLVHYRPSKKRIELSEHVWNLITCAMSDLVRESYDAIGHKFYTAENSDVSESL